MPIDETSRQPGYLPPSRPYELTHLTLDLIRLARYLLVPHGRLVFFLPTTSEEYKTIKLPEVEGMIEIRKGGVPVQDFGSWGRRVRKVFKCVSRANLNIDDNDGEGCRGRRRSAQVYRLLCGRTQGGRQDVSGTGESTPHWPAADMAQYWESFAPRSNGTQASNTPRPSTNA